MELERVSLTETDERQVKSAEQNQTASISRPVLIYPLAK